MRRRLPAVLSALAFSAAALAGCSGDTEVEVPQVDLSEVDLPSVDWDKYGPQVREEVEGLVENADCDGLREQLDGADEQLRGYIDAALDEAGC